MTDTYQPYLDCVAVYPVFSAFYAAIVADFYFPIPGMGDLYTAWYEARSQLTGNYFTHFDERGLPVDQHNNIFWTWAGGAWHCTERHARFHLQFDRIGETEMIAALRAYNAA